MLQAKLNGYMKDKDYRELLKGSGITFLLRFLSFVLLYVLNFMIAKIYGADALGIYTLSFTLLSIALTLVLIGTDTSVVRFISEYRSQNALKEANKIFIKIIKLLLPLSCIFSVGFYFLAEPIAIKVFKEQLLITPIKIISIVLPFMVIARIYAKAFRAVKSITKSIYYEIIGIRLGTILILLLFILFFEKNILHIIYALSIAIIIAALMGMFSWNGDYQSFEINKKRGGPDEIKVKSMKEILIISLPMYLTSSMVLILNWTDTVMLGIFYNTEVVGIYSIVLKLSLLISFSLSSINMIILPKFSELYWGGRKQDLIKVFRFSAMLTFWLSIPILVITILLSPILLSVFGENYIVGTIPLTILCIGQCINCCTGSVMQLLNMTGHEKQAKNAIMVSAGVNLVCNALLIPLFGMIGAAIATSFSIIIRELIATMYAYRIFKFRTWYIPFKTLKLSEDYSE
ncbi:flippase [Chengkuizengella sediminis]|nr:flippase [Chengkuizengella sediminis]